jgi:threo-3-hydroxy-L-aspartate ammonia-lyase
MPELVDMNDIERAAGRLRGLVRHTPTWSCERLSEQTGARVFVKAENLQHAGSFKVRGTFNTLLSWRECGDLPSGVATFSAGNHAAAVAYATSRLGIPAVVCMPPGAVASKVAAVRRYGAELVFTEDLPGTCHQIMAERGYRLLHPFDDPLVIAGHGTAGTELLAKVPTPDLVLVPVGGGGLISGIATAIKARSPVTRVVGVEPAVSPAVSLALRHGGPVPLPGHAISIADGLCPPFTGDRPFAHIQAFVDEVVEISEEAILPAWWHLLDATKLLAEPSAAVGLAAMLSDAVSWPADATVVLVVSGGNTSPDGLRRLAQ